MVDKYSLKQNLKQKMGYVKSILKEVLEKKSQGVDDCPLKELETLKSGFLGILICIPKSAKLSQKDKKLILRTVKEMNILLKVVLVNLRLITLSQITRFLNNKRGGKSGKK